MTREIQYKHIYFKKMKYISVLNQNKYIKLKKKKYTSEFSYLC